MIKIVVRHHSHHRHNRSQESPELDQEHNNKSNRKRLNQDPGAATSKKKSTSNQKSSCVEIKYSKMSTPPAVAPKAAMRSVHKSAPVAMSRQKVPMSTKSVQQLPRGSLSSCSSSSPDLSGNEETEYYCRHHPEERYSFNYSLSVFDESSADELDDMATELSSNSDQKTVRTVPARVAPTRAPQTLHTRSVSLIVNPDFDSSSGEESEPTTQASTMGSAKYKRGRNRFHYRQASHCPVVQGEFREADFLRLKQLKEELEAIKLTDAESARLREIGFFLRQVSDEFALDRRLTI